MRFAQGWIASEVLQWCLPKGGLRAKSYDDVCPKVDCEQSPVMRFAQGWIASKVCNDVCLRVDREQNPTMRLCPRVDREWSSAMILNQDRSANRRCNGSLGNCKGGTAKGERCWWQQMGIVKRRFRLIVRLKAIKYYEGLLCYLSSYNLLVSDLWLDPDLMFRPLIQGWYVAFATHASHPLSGRNRNCYYYLLSTSFVRIFAHSCVCSLVRLYVRSFWLYPLTCERSKT